MKTQSDIDPLRWGIDFHFTGDKIAIGDPIEAHGTNDQTHEDGKVYFYTVNSDETWKLDKIVFPTHTYSTSTNKSVYPFGLFGYGVRFDENYLYVIEEAKDGRTTSYGVEAPEHSKIHIYDINQPDSESGYAFVTTLTIDQISGMSLSHSLMNDGGILARINNIDLLGGNLIVTINMSTSGGNNDPLIVELSETSTGVWERVQDISVRWVSTHPIFNIAYNNNWRETVVVGSGRIVIRNSNLGSVQIFEKNASGTWEETHVFRYPCSSGSSSGFGFQTSISGDFLLIGDSSDSSYNNTDIIHGSVFYYQLDPTITPQFRDKLSHH